MKCLLDSTTVSEIYKSSSINHHHVISKLLSLREEDEIFISVLTLYEKDGRFFDSYYETQEEFYAAIEELKA